MGPNPTLIVKREKNDTKEEDKVKAYTFETYDKLLEFAAVNESKNCFGLNFTKVDTKKYDYEVTYSFSQFRSVNTLYPMFTPLVSKPDMTNWNTALESAWIYPYITDFLAKYQSGKHDFSDASFFNQQPYFGQDIGYTPMPTSDYVDIDEGTLNQLANQFPNFVQFNHLFIFVYIIQGLVGEKETKARQGMKIMGLQDSTYFVAWFIHFLFLSIYNSIW